jgi:putative transcriptional regulator
MQFIFASMGDHAYDGPETVITMSTNIRMKVARVERGWNQQELADRVEATRQTIGLIEKGEYNPSLKLCLRIAKALGRTLDQLFWEEENP